jgi:hypothetical protein
MHTSPGRSSKEGRVNEREMERQIHPMVVLELNSDAD